MGGVVRARSEVPSWPTVPIQSTSGPRAAAPIAPPKTPASHFGEAFDHRTTQLARNAPGYSPDVRFLRDGAEALQGRLDAINNATSSILMTTYALEADSTTESVLRALIARARLGVRVVVKS